VSSRARWTSDLVRVAGLCLLVGLACGTPDDGPSDTAAVYFTRGLREPDKLASAWLISRVVAPRARIVFLDDDDPEPPVGVEFDGVTGPWSRQSRLTTFEIILSDRDVDTPDRAALDQISRLVRASEFSSWMLEPTSEQGIFDRRMKLLARTADTETVFAFLDSIRAENTPESEQVTP